MGHSGGTSRDPACSRSRLSAPAPTVHLASLYRARAYERPEYLHWRLPRLNRRRQIGRITTTDLVRAASEHLRLSPSGLARLAVAQLAFRLICRPENAGLCSASSLTTIGGCCSAG